MLSIHNQPLLEEYARRRRIDPHRLQQLGARFFKRQEIAAECLQMLPESERAAFAQDVAFHSLELQQSVDSHVDGASKLVFRNRSGLLLETVILRIASGRTAVCVSTQVGCAARCAFCATGAMGMVHNLDASEILDQVVQVNQQLRSEGRRVRNVVFMGMGEPFHNEAALFQALDVLLSPRGLGLSPRHLLVSTVGIPDAMRRCARQYPKVGVALSLHSARQEERERLIPLARRYPLAELRRAVEDVTACQQRPVMIEYLLLGDRTDTAADVLALTDFLHGLRVHVNLIPFNPIDGASSLRGTEPKKAQAFAEKLRGAGFKVTMRYSLGADIAAACGQLVRRQTRLANTS